jgi:hypothetical protein
MWQSKREISQECNDIILNWVSERITNKRKILRRSGERADVYLEVRKTLYKKRFPGTTTYSIQIQIHLFNLPLSTLWSYYASLCVTLYNIEEKWGRGRCLP